MYKNQFHCIENNIKFDGCMNHAKAQKDVFFSKLLPGGGILRYGNFFTIVCYNTFMLKTEI